jgi:hypothetical protein
MRNLDINIVEEMLEGKISKNLNRFECANGIVFSVNNMNDQVKEYFADRGIEHHELVSGIYYTETIMTAAEFSNLDHVMYTKKLA